MIVLAVGLLVARFPGVVVGCVAVVSGVVAEAIYAAIAVRPVLREHIWGKRDSGVPLTLGAFLHFWQMYRTMTGRKK